MKFWDRTEDRPCTVLPKKKKNLRRRNRSSKKNDAYDPQRAISEISDLLGKRGASNLG